MSFSARLVHDLTIIRTTFDDMDPDDEYGQPSETQQEIAVRGLIQPKTVREQFQSQGAGPAIADHTIFFEPMTLYGSDQIVDSGGQRYSVTGIRSFEFGHTPHLEVDALAVTRGNDNQVLVGS